MKTSDEKKRAKSSKRYFLINLFKRFIQEVLNNSELIVTGKMGRLNAQKCSKKIGFGEMLIRVVYEEINSEKVVVTAYWTQPKRYAKKDEL